MTTWKWWEEDSFPYTVDNLPRVLTTNWSADTKYPGLYLSRESNPYFSGIIVCFLVPVDILFDCDNKHVVHAGTGYFEVDFNPGQIKGGNTTSF